MCKIKSDFGAITVVNVTHCGRAMITWRLLKRVLTKPLCVFLKYSNCKGNSNIFMLKWGLIFEGAGNSSVVFFPPHPAAELGKAVWAGPAAVRRAGPAEPRSAGGSTAPISQARILGSRGRQTGRARPSFRVPYVQRSRTLSPTESLQSQSTFTLNSKNFFQLEAIH